MPKAGDTHPTTQLVLNQLKKVTVGVRFYYGDIADAIGVPKDRVASAMGRLTVKYPEMGLSRSGPIGWYIYYPPKPPEPEARQEPAESRTELWEELGKLGDRILVRNSLNQIKFLADE